MRNTSAGTEFSGDEHVRYACRKERRVAPAARSRNESSVTNASRRKVCCDDDWPRPRSHLLIQRLKRTASTANGLCNSYWKSS